MRTRYTVAPAAFTLLVCASLVPGANAAWTDESSITVPDTQVGIIESSFVRGGTEYQSIPFGFKSDSDAVLASAGNNTKAATGYAVPFTQEVTSNGQTTLTQSSLTAKAREWQAGLSDTNPLSDAEIKIFPVDSESECTAAAGKTASESLGSIDIVDDSTNDTVTQMWCAFASLADDGSGEMTVNLGASALVTDDLGETKRVESSPEPVTIQVETGYVGENSPMTTAPTWTVTNNKIKGVVDSGN